MENTTLIHFEIFLAVAREGGFTAAAKVLGQSKAAVSKTIRLLEEDLGVPLFYRTTRRVSLTHEGRLLQVQCGRLHEELNTTRQLLSQFHEAPTGVLRISCNPYFAKSHLWPLLEKYRACCPDVRVEVFSEERMPDMFQENYDIVFAVNWPAPDEVVARPIGKTRYVFCAAPDYLKKHGTPKTQKDLERHEYIPHLGRSSDNWVAPLKSPIEVLQKKSRLGFNDAALMKQAALSGWGIVQLHEYMVHEELKSKHLISVLDTILNPSVDLYMYYQKNRFVQPKVRQFVNLV
jgi:DNA-binding transcriptional LysR family regulator